MPNVGISNLEGVLIYPESILLHIFSNLAE